MGGALEAQMALEAPGRRHLGGGIWEEACEGRHLKGRILGGALGELWGGSGVALGGLWESSAKASGALAALEAPGVSGMVYLHFTAHIRR